MTPSATCDLTNLGGCQIAELVAIKLAVLCKCHMINIKVKSHADRIGRNQKIDIARLIKLNLRIAGAWTERTHHHGSTTTLTSDQFCNRINFVG